MIAQNGLALGYEVTRLGWRLKLSLVTQLELADGSRCWAQIRNISSRGFMVQSSRRASMGQKLRIMLPGAGLVAADVRWTDGQHIGCRLERPLGPSGVARELLFIVRSWIIARL